MARWHFNKIILDQFLLPATLSVTYNLVTGHTGHKSYQTGHRNWYQMIPDTTSTLTQISCGALQFPECALLAGWLRCAKQSCQKFDNTIISTPALLQSPLGGSQEIADKIVWPTAATSLLSACKRINQIPLNVKRYPAAWRIRSRGCCCLGSFVCRTVFS